PLRRAARRRAFTSAARAAYHALAFAVLHPRHQVCSPSLHFRFGRNQSNGKNREHREHRFTGQLKSSVVYQVSNIAISFPCYLPSIIGEFLSSERNEIRTV